MKSATVILLLALGTLSGCTESQKAVAVVAVEKIKATNDTIAQGALQAPCGITVGAFHRLENSLQKQGVDLLCGGSGESPLSVEDLGRINSAVEIFRDLAKPPAE